MNPSEEKAKPPEKQKALCVATRCATVEQFVQTFHRFCDESSFFVATLATRPVGLETAFSIQLEDKTPVLRGLCVVVEAWATPANRFGRPGVRLNVRRLTNESLPVFKQLQAARIAAEQAAAEATLAKAGDGEVTFDSKTADMNVLDAREAAKQGAAQPVPVQPLPEPPPIPAPLKGPDTKPIAVTLASKVGPEPTLAEKLAAVKAGKAPGKKSDGIPPIPKLSPTAFASPPPIPSVTKPAEPAKPVEAPPATPSIIIDMPGDAPPIEPAKVRAEGTAPTMKQVPRAVTTPAIGISTSTVTHSNVEQAAETTQADATVPEPVVDAMTSPVASESRAPGSSFVLPANPLMNLSDQSLEGFVDCALYEETGNFAKAPGYEDSLVDIDDVAPPPPLPPGLGLTPAAVIRPGTEHSQVSYIGPVPAQYPTGQMPPLAYPMQTGTTNPPYVMVMQAPPQAPVDSTAALLAMSAPNRRRWMIIGGSAVIASLLLLVIVLATRGDDKAATAATKAPVVETVKPPVEPVQPAEVAMPAPAPPPQAPVAAVDEPDEVPADTGAPPVVGSGPCKMTVTTTPAGSIVRVDDQVIGPSPVTIQGPCKRTKVDAKHPRYAPAMKWVVLDGEKPASVDLPMTRPTHSVTIVTKPAGATISIAGRRAGTSPTQVKLMGFTTVALTIEKKGYKTVVEKIYSKVDGSRRTVTLSRGK